MPRRYFYLCLLLLVLVGLGVGGYVLYYRGYFSRDAEDGAEIARLAERQVGLPPVGDAAAGWFQWRGPTRDGRAPAGPFRTDWDKTPPRLLWAVSALGGTARPIGGGYSSPVVVGGRVFLQDYHDGEERVVCLDAVTGKFLWEKSFPADYSGTDRTYATGPRATPAVEGNSLYVVSAAGELLRIDYDDTAARIVWRSDLLREFDAPKPQWGVACSPLIEGPLVIVQPGGTRGSVAALDKNTGDIRWRAGSNPPGYSSPVAATFNGVRTILALTGDALLAVRADDGTVTDSYDWKTRYNGNIATPLVVDDYVFISSAYGQGSALLRVESRNNGPRFVPVYARRGRAFQNHHSSSVFLATGEKDRYLFGFDGQAGSARLKCVNFDTGRDQEGWEADGLGTGSGTLILVDRHLVIQTERGELALVEASPREFRLVARLPRVLSGRNNWSSPALVDGRLYLRDESKLVCYDVRP